MQRIRKNRSAYYIDTFGVPVIVSYLSVPKDEKKYRVEEPSGRYRTENLKGFKKITKQEYDKLIQGYQFDQVDYEEDTDEYFNGKW